MVKPMATVVEKEIVHAEAPGVASDRLLYLEENGLRTVLLPEPTGGTNPRWTAS